MSSHNKQFASANFPTTAEGRTYHVGTKRGEVANRIILVGDADRAIRISQLLDSTLFKYESPRKFITVTGRYKGTPVTIIAVGMGYPMVDMAVRECRPIVDGEIAMIRLGTCGSPIAKVGSVAVATSGVVVLRNPDGFRKNAGEKGAQKYFFSLPIYPDQQLTNKLQEDLVKVVGEEWVVPGANATCDSFYSSQGRITKDFGDGNETLVDEMEEKIVGLSNIEMETAHLFDLAECSGSIKAAAAMIVLAQRRSDDFIKIEFKQQRELEIGKAALETLIATQLKGEMDTPECIWNKQQ